MGDCKSSDKIEVPKQLAKERSIFIIKMQKVLQENNKHDPNIEKINACKLELEKI